MNHLDDRGLQAIRQRAYSLAETGRFSSATSVQQALVGEGWPNAAQALESEFARKAISERCRAAQAH